MQRDISVSQLNVKMPSGSFTHADATANDFCLCHLLCVWRITARLGIYLGYYNVGYAESVQRFVYDEQLYVQLMALLNFATSLAYLCFSQHWIYDPQIYLLYTPLYVYFLLLRQHLTWLLNECAAIHAALQRTLGTLLCVRIRQQSVLALLVPLLGLLLLLWQTQMYYAYQTCFIAAVSLIYYMLLMFEANYLIWLGCTYRAFNVFLTLHLCSKRLRMLRQMLRQQRCLERLHWHIMRYFGLHMLSFVCLLALRAAQLWQRYGEGSSNTLHVRADRLQLCNLALLVLLLIAFLVIGQDLEQQRVRFRRNLLRLSDEPRCFQLKSWHLLKHQMLPMPFGLPLLRHVARRKARKRYKRDIISLMFSNDYCVTNAHCTPLILALLRFGHYELSLRLSFLRQCFVKSTLLLLLVWTLKLQQHRQLRVEFYTAYPPRDIDSNVTSSISQVYRWYTYDEVE